MKHSILIQMNNMNKPIFVNKTLIFDNIWSNWTFREFIY